MCWSCPKRTPNYQASAHWARKPFGHVGMLILHNMSRDNIAIVEADPQRFFQQFVTMTETSNYKQQWRHTEFRTSNKRQTGLQASWKSEATTAGVALQSFLCWISWGSHKRNFRRSSILSLSPGQCSKGSLVTTLVCTCTCTCRGADHLD